MRSHPNARLMQKGRLRLVTQHLEHGRGLSELAAEHGISLRCAYRWLARYRSVDPQQLQHAVDLRHQRLHLRHIARLLPAPFSTVARALSRLGLGRLKNLEPRPPVQRYEWERTGDLIHIDVKQLARFRQVGHRITGNRQRSAARSGSRCRLPGGSVFVSPLAQFSLSPDSQGLPHPGAAAHPDQALHAQDQRQSGAVWPPADCVYIQTLCREWAYAMAFQNSEGRNCWLPR